MGGPAFRGFSESRLLSGAGAGAVYFVLWNRLDRLTLLEAGVEHVAGALEIALYTVPYRRHERLARASSLDELRGMLRGELDFLDAVEADGWELVGRPGNRVVVSSTWSTRDVPTRVSCKPRSCRTPGASG